MDDHQIILNEVLNDGSRIYFYYDRNSDTHVVYGYSAFLLSSMKDLHYDKACFSTKLQMPCLSMSETDFRKISQDFPDFYGSDSDNCFWKTNSVVDENQYRIWVTELKLRDLMSAAGQIRSDIDSGLSSCLSLSYICVSICRLLSGYDPEDGLGTGRYYFERGRELFEILEKKLPSARTVTTQTRIILAMYRLNHEIPYLYNQISEERCNEAVRTLFRNTLSRSISLSDLESAFLCQCLAHSLYLEPDQDHLSNDMRAFLDRNISSWMSYDWVCDVSPAVMIARLQVLVCNSDMFLDSRYDKNISLMADYLCRKIDVLSDIDKIALYPLISDIGSPAYKPSFADHLSVLEYPDSLKYDSLYMQIDRWCRKLQVEIENKLI